MLCFKVAVKASCVMGILVSTGCSVIQRVGMAFQYREAPLGNTKVVRDISYGSSGNPKQRLDLFYPAGTNWPVMIYVLGGGWTSGDKGLRVGGKDVYGNIGRFYAARGIGVAVINYRLQPEVTWRAQVDDVAASMAWVVNEASRYGADTTRIFLVGHSSGAYLSCFVALNPEPMTKHSIPAQALRGVVSVSGAGLDMADKMTCRLGEKRRYYEERFCDGVCQTGWDVEASPIHYITSNAPPFLILYAGGEKKALQRQSHLLAEELTAHAGHANLIEVPGQSHQRMVLVLSREENVAAQAILDFIKNPTKARDDREEVGRPREGIPQKR